MSTLYNKLVRCPACNIKFPARTNYVNPLHEKKSSHQVAVEKAMEISGQELPFKPVIPSLEVRKLRAQLILEEAIETINALGFFICDDFQFKYEPEWGKSLKDIVDGCCDLHVVTTGTLSACGICDVRMQELVDDNNLEKFSWTQEEITSFFGEEDKIQDFTWARKNINGEMFTIVKNKQGKYIKPPHHKPPMLEEEIKNQLNL